MTIQILTNRDWKRNHDLNTSAIRPGAEKIYCFDELEDLIKICAEHPPGKKLKAAGSHWALSEAALSDNEFIETNWPGTESVPRYSGLDDVDFGQIISDSLFEFLVSHPPIPAEKATLDPCLNPGESGAFFVHVKSGTRIYRLYNLLDSLLDEENKPLNLKLAADLNKKLIGTKHADAYNGPWAFSTLGGAGGQTIFGALTTGTHGGDYKQPPISDSVVAVHLVTDGGDHFWIEPTPNAGRYDLPIITDDNKLIDQYGKFPGVSFKIIRDNNVFDSVVVSAGRFGIVASLVLRVVPQYCLHDHRVLANWSTVKSLLNSPQQHHFFDRVYSPVPGQEQIENRFLQIGINICPHKGNEHRCGITQRWFVSHDAQESKNPDGTLRGRKERGTLVTAGTSYSYEPPSDDPNKPGSSSGTFISKACSNGNFLVGVIRTLIDEVEEIIKNAFVSPGKTVEAALAIGTGAAILSICPVLAALLALLIAIEEALAALGVDFSLAQGIDIIVNKFLLKTNVIPREIALMALRAILLLVFEGQQSNHDFAAISYAIMDIHDYKDRSCFGNAESIEVFFDATKPDVYCTYVDQILAFESLQQETQGILTVGYISLRYVQRSNGLIAPARFPETVVMEIAGLRDTEGTSGFIQNAIKCARHPQRSVPFHWGQDSPLTQLEIERIFNNTEPQVGNLDTWRAALRLLTKNGQQDGFSSDFTRRTGLEP
jgi:hypothetical protein